MIKITFTNQAALDRFLTAGPRIVESLVTRTNTLLIQLQAYIVQNKLSGQVLARRSGKLAGSVRVVPAVVSGTQISGEVQAAGGTASYGAIHEKGGTGPYEILPVNAKALSFMLEGRLRAFASVMHPGLPPRPFMSPSLEEMRDTIVNELQDALNQGMEGA